MGQLRTEGPSTDSNFSSGAVLKSRLDEKPMRKESSSFFEHVQNGLWITLAAFLFNYLDIVHVVREDRRIQFPVLYSALGSTVVFFILASYHVVWLSWVKKIKEADWEKAFPIGVPLATVCILLSSFLFTIAFWGVWSIFTPLILFVFAMPVIVLLSYL